MSEQTHPEQGDSWSVNLYRATSHQREHLELIHGPFASDVCILVEVDGRLIGWGDDYGTLRLLPAQSLGKVEDAGEELLATAARFWEVCQR